MYTDLQDSKMGGGKKLSISHRMKAKGVFAPLLGILIMLFLLGPLNANPSEVGRIVGKLIDSETEEPLIGANVTVAGLPIGASTDVDGVYIINNVPEGEHKLIIQYIGYKETTITDVSVSFGQSTKMEAIELEPETIQGEEVVVEARFIKNTEAALLSKRLESEAITDGLSAEAISRTGAGEAAEAMTQVTGASVMDGKYVYVRGLGDRYASTQLNGAELPSADPDKRSFNMDLVPSDMLDNIVTSKTFTPDQPGNFSGGIVNMGTRAFPDKLHFSISTGSSWNSSSSLQSGFLSYSGGDTDWLGFDDGTRDIPDFLKHLGEEENLPTDSEARFDDEKAALLDKGSNSLSSIMAPSSSKSPLNNSFSISFGNQSKLFGKPLGYLGSVSYDRSFSFYDDGTVGRWKLSGNVATTDSLNRLTELTDTKGEESILWGGMGTLTYQFLPTHELQVNFMKTQSGTDESRYLIGPWPEQNVENLETRVLRYTERSLTSWQLRGNHEFNGRGGLKINWIGTTASSAQDEPDARFFSNTFREIHRPNLDTVVYQIPVSILNRPARYFRELEEDNQSMQVNLTQPFQLWNGETGRIKVGHSYQEKDRNFEEHLFEYYQGNGISVYNGDPQEYFGPGNTGIVGFDSTRGQYLIGNYIRENKANIFGGDYWGDQRINAGYLMLDVPLLKDLRLIGGVRLESTRMNVSNGEVSGKLDDDDWLPSINTTYNLFQQMNIRAAYGRTLARPSFREKAPYASFEFFNDFTFNGNPALKRTLIDNYDLRWDWFLQPGELISVSGFYKEFKNPIERVINPFFSSEGALLFYDNVDQAELYGLEFELRKKLGIIHPFLRNFMFVGNLSLINSNVTIPDEEYVQIQALDSTASRKRDLQGQSPFLLNLNLLYQHLPIGTTVSLYYNVFGERLYEVSLGGTPNTFEQPRHMLNLTIDQRLWKNLNVKFKAKNLLDESFVLSQEFKGAEYIRHQYDLGRTFSLGLKYNLD